MYHIRWYRHSRNLLVFNCPIISDVSGVELRLHVVEYSRRQRIEHIAPLDDSLTMNLQRFMEDTSGDWEILAICRDFDSAFDFAALLRERFPERFELPQKQ